MAFYECVPKYKRETNALPAGYQRCLYLQSSGTQKIDTGITSDNFVSITMDAEYTKLSGLQFLFGFIWGSADGIQAGAYETAVSVRYGSYSTDKNSLSVANVYRYIVGAETVTIEGDVFYTPPNRVYPSGSLMIFGRSNAKDNASAKIYDVTITMDDNINNDFIPCLDDTGKPGLYSTQFKNIYYNIGSGEFGYELMDGTIVSPI